MVRYITLAELIALHYAAIRRVTTLNLPFHPANYPNKDKLESIIAQPKLTFGGDELYPTLFDKAAILIFAIITNHPFYDANKRTGILALATFLMLHGYKLVATQAEQVELVYQVARNEISRPEFLLWLEQHTSQSGLQIPPTN